MNAVEPGIYFGTVTHRRLRPVEHHLAYDVASVFVDVDDLAGGLTPVLLSHNRFNLFSIHDKDHGEADGRSISDFAWSTVRSIAGSEDVARIYMLCYPRLLGFGFNPLTTYFCVSSAGEPCVMIYEVRNTFGGRHVYVTDAISPGYARTEKLFRVSPFNSVEGTYGLRASDPGETVTVGVALTTDDGPLLKAYFTGKRKPLTSLQLMRVFFGLPFMSLKVILAIHWEALKLWKKGLKLHS
jgi:uncharacterized protein